ncbi:MAG: hypothetical protein AAFU79_12550 [Myxococcota bacterium]
MKAANALPLSPSAPASRGPGALTWTPSATPRRAPLGLDCAILAIAVQLGLAVLLAWSEARVGHRVQAWAEVGGRYPYVLHLVAFASAVPLNISQIARRLETLRPDLYWRLGTLSSAQTVVMLVTGYALMARASALSLEYQIYHEGTVVLVSLGVGVVFAFAWVMTLVSRAHRDGASYRIWNTRLLWLVLGFVLHRFVSIGLLIAFPELDRGQAVCASFGLSSIWAFMIIEYGLVAAVRRAEEASR